MSMFSAIGRAMKAKGTASAVARGKSSARSSGASANRRMAGVQNYVKNNKGKSALMGGAAVGAVGIGRSRRSGLDKTTGRPTGIYEY